MPFEVDMLSNRTPSNTRCSLGINKQASATNYADLFPEETMSESMIGTESFVPKPASDLRQKIQSQNRECNNSGNRKSPGLRNISRQLINCVRNSRQPLTYKQVADLVTADNHDEILAECAARHPRSRSTQKQPRLIKGKNGTINMDGTLNEHQFRAIENYRRRIYDAWSVLRASNIIVKVDSKHFRYNCDVLEGAQDQVSDDTGKVTITAEKLCKILESINSIQNDQWGGENMRKDRRSDDQKNLSGRSNKINEDHEAILEMVNATEEKCSKMYDRLRDRITDLRDVSASSSALKRIIKRNRKRDERIERACLGPKDRRARERDNICRMPFVVAKY